METKIIRTFGQIFKTESLIPIQTGIMHNTTVVEANKPYKGNYYGSWPAEIKPNSLFLFTKKFYSLTEVLYFSTGLDFCRNTKINVASALINFNNEQHPAIRIKYFPDYQNLTKLQECMVSEGVEFLHKIHIPSEAFMKVSKIFELNEAETGIYIDLQEKNKGYINISKRLNDEEFDELLTKLHKNSDCCLFGAVKCIIYINGFAVNTARIFSEGLNIRHLLCIRDKILRLIN